MYFPQQQDGVSCGVRVMASMTVLAYGSPLNVSSYSDDMGSLRKRFAEDLYAGKVRRLAPIPSQDGEVYKVVFTHSDC